MWRGGVGPSIGERSEPSTGLRYAVEDVEQVPGASRQAVQAGHQQNVASRKGSDRLRQLATISDSAADLLAVEPLCACGLGFETCERVTPFAGLAQTITRPTRSSYRSTARQSGHSQRAHCRAGC